MNRCENLQKLLKKYCQHQQASMQYTKREEEEGNEERRWKEAGQEIKAKAKKII